MLCFCSLEAKAEKTTKLWNKKVKGRQLWWVRLYMLYNNDMDSGKSLVERKSFDNKISHFLAWLVYWRGGHWMGGESLDYLPEEKKTIFSQILDKNVKKVVFTESFCIKFFKKTKANLVSEWAAQVGIKSKNTYHNSQISTKLTTFAYKLSSKFSPFWRFFFEKMARLTNWLVNTYARHSLLVVYIFNGGRADIYSKIVSLFVCLAWLYIDHLVSLSILARSLIIGSFSREKNRSRKIRAQPSLNRFRSFFKLGP